MNIEDLPPKLQAQARAKLGGINKPSKYHAEKTEVDGIRFDSRKEADFYAHLKLLEKAGEIENLELQPEYVLQEPFTCDGKKERAIKYIADFRYHDVKRDKLVVVDVKGVRTGVYKLKRKLFLYKYGERVEFREV